MRPKAGQLPISPELAPTPPVPHKTNPMPARANTSQNVYTLPLPQVGRVLVYLLTVFLPSHPSSQL